MICHSKASSVRKHLKRNLGFATAWLPFCNVSQRKESLLSIISFSSVDSLLNTSSATRLRSRDKQLLLAKSLCSCWSVRLMSYDEFNNTPTIQKKVVCL